MSAKSSLEPGDEEDFMEITEEGRKEDRVDHSTELRVWEPAWVVLLSPLGGEEDIWKCVEKEKRNHNNLKI